MVFHENETTCSSKLYWWIGIRYCWKTTGLSTTYSSKLYLWICIHCRTFRVFQTAWPRPIFSPLLSMKGEPTTVVACGNGNTVPLLTPGAGKIWGEFVTINPDPSSSHKQPWKCTLCHHRYGKTSANASRVGQHVCGKAGNVTGCPGARSAFPNTSVSRRRLQSPPHQRPSP